MLRILEHKVENTPYIHEYPFPTIELPRNWIVRIGGTSLNLSPTRHIVYMWLAALVTIVLLGLCFYYRPDLLTWWLRSTMGLIETGSGLLPYPWGDRIEVALRAIGGSFWFQITLAIIAVRLVAWLIAVSWRNRPSRRRLRAQADLHQATPARFR